MDAKLIETIKNSGNNLHLEVVKILEDRGWNVDLNSYYYDDTALKPREIDIIAWRAVNVNSGFGKIVDTFYVHLFIECKYFKNSIAFRLRDNQPEVAKAAVSIEGLNKDEIYPAMLEGDHHYFAVQKVGKLYDTPQEEQEKVFNAITQPIKSLNFFRDRKARKGLYYSLVIYDGIDGVYALEESDLQKLNTIQTQPNLIFAVNYTYKNITNGILKTQLYYVDFIRKDETDKFLDTIEQKEIRHLSSVISFQRVYERR